MLFFLLSSLNHHKTSVVSINTHYITHSHREVEGTLLLALHLDVHSDQVGGGADVVRARLGRRVRSRAEVTVQLQEPLKLLLCHYTCIIFRKNNFCTMTVGPKCYLILAQGTVTN